MKFVGLKMKSAGSIKVTENNNLVTAPLKRSDSLDRGKASKTGEEKSGVGWFGRYLSKKKQQNTSSSSSSSPSLEVSKKQASRKDEDEDSVVDINESFTIDRRDHRLQRSKIASRWENLHAEDDEDVNVH